MAKSCHQSHKKVSTYGECVRSSATRISCPNRGAQLPTFNYSGPVPCALCSYDHVTHPSPFQFPAVLVAMLVSTVPVSILGAHNSIDVVPFCTPEQCR